MVTMVVSDGCIINLAYGWWVLIQSIVGIVRGRNWSLSGPVWWRSVVTLSDCRYPLSRNLNFTVPVDVVRVKSYVDSLLNSKRVPVRVSVYKLNFVLERIMPGLIAVFRNCQSLSSWKSYIPIVLLNQFMHAPSCFANVYFAAFIRNLIHYSILFSWIHRILWSH